MMIAWWWLIVVAMLSMAAGIFLVAVLKANDEEQQVEDFKHELKLDNDMTIFMTDGDHNKLKLDKYGVSIYDPETGDWRPLN